MEENVKGKGKEENCTWAIILLIISVIGGIVAAINEEWLLTGICILLFFGAASCGDEDDGDSCDPSAGGYM